MSVRPLRAFARVAALSASLTVSWAASAQQELVMGALLPLTGPAASIGLDQQQGIQFAIDKVNADGGIRGRKVNIIFEDSQAKPDVGVLSFNRLVDLRHVPAVMTAFSSGRRRTVCVAKSMCRPLKRSQSTPEPSPPPRNSLARNSGH
jgi:hypothetical protein